MSGAKGVIVPNGGPKSEILFTEVMKDKGFNAQCKLPLCVMHFEHELEEVKGAGTRATHRVIKASRRNYCLGTPTSHVKTTRFRLR